MLLLWLLRLVPAGPSSGSRTGAPSAAVFPMRAPVFTDVLGAPLVVVAAPGLPTARQREDSVRRASPGAPINNGFSSGCCRGSASGSRRRTTKGLALSAGAEPVAVLLLLLLLLLLTLRVPVQRRGTLPARNRSNVRRPWPRCVLVVLLVGVPSGT